MSQRRRCSSLPARATESGEAFRAWSECCGAKLPRSVTAKTKRWLPRPALVRYPWVTNDVANPARPWHEALHPPVGHSVITARLVNASLRFVAGLSGESRLTEALRHGDDCGHRLAEMIYDAPVEAKSPRWAMGWRVMRACTGGATPDELFAGIVADGLDGQDGHDLAFCQSAHSAYFSEYPGVKTFFSRMHDVLHRMAAAKKTTIGPLEFRADEVVHRASGHMMHFSGIHFDYATETFSFSTRQKDALRWHRLTGPMLANRLGELCTRVCLADAVMALEPLQDENLYAVDQRGETLLFTMPTEAAHEKACVIAALMRRMPKWMPNAPLLVDVRHSPTFWLAATRVT